MDPLPDLVLDRRPNPLAVRLGALRPGKMLPDLDRLGVALTEPSLDFVLPTGFFPFLGVGESPFSKAPSLARAAILPSLELSVPVRRSGDIPVPEVRLASPDLLLAMSRLDLGGDN